MTIAQASERFGVSLDKLRFYENNGLFDCHKKADGSIDYNDELMDYIGIINVLLDAGVPMDALRCFMEKLMKSTITTDEKLRFLRKQRENLLCHIHEKQRSLDQLDYIIYFSSKTMK